MLGWYIQSRRSIGSGRTLRRRGLLRRVAWTGAKDSRPGGSSDTSFAGFARLPRAVRRGRRLGLFGRLEPGVALLEFLVVAIAGVAGPVVCGGELLPAAPAQRGQERRPRDEARERACLLLGTGMLRGGEGLDVGEAGVGIVEAHDLEQAPAGRLQRRGAVRSEEHTSELQSLMRISYAVFCLE